MNTEKNVFNKLFKEEKVELATQKVELGIVQDLDKATNSIKRAISDASRIFRNMYDRRNKVDGYIDDIKILKNDLRDSKGVKANLGGSLQDLEKLSNKLEASAKELGVSAEKITGVKEALIVQSDGYELIKEILSEEKRTEKTLNKLN